MRSRNLPLPADQSLNQRLDQQSIVEATHSRGASGSESITRFLFRERKK
jgi:hypothetical protein